MNYLPGMNPNVFADDCDKLSKLNAFLSCALDREYTCVEPTQERLSILTQCFEKKQSPCIHCVKNGKTVECNSGWQVRRYGCRFFLLAEEQKKQAIEERKKLLAIKRSSRNGWAQELAIANAKEHIEFWKKHG